MTRQITGGMTTGFTRQLRDGSIEQFTLGLGTKFFLTSVADPQGNTVTLGYDAQTRLTTITDAIGQVSKLSYDLASDPLKVTQVTDPFGRSATFAYTADGHLAGITDVLGITSEYTWGPKDFITTLTTPYGVSSFTWGDATTDPTLGTSRFATITDALGRTTRVEFRQAAPGIQISDPPATVPFSGSQVSLNDNYLQWRNTFVWSPTQLQAAMGPTGLDYTKARILHWLHTPDHTSTGRVLESEKEPLENRVWYEYVGSQQIYFGNRQELASAGRVVEGGNDTTTFQWDSVGNVIQATDAAGRQTFFGYAPNGIDLVTLDRGASGKAPEHQTTLAYNAQHRPTSITDASGQTTMLDYNPRGQLTKVTDALGNATTYTYDANGYLTTIQSPVAGSTYGFTYDAFGRVASVTDPAQITVMYAYDAADRPTSATFPDGTSTTFAYNLLDLASVTDRLGQTTSFAYDAGRELVQTKDPLGNTVTLNYCACGQVSSIVDPLGNTTTFDRDLEDRVVAKHTRTGQRRSTRTRTAAAGSRP
jgi:YD repeat-containing protein